MKPKLRIMNGSEQQPPSEQIPPVETGTNFRSSVEELIPGIRPDDGYKPNVRFEKAQAKSAEMLVRLLIGDSHFQEFMLPLRGTIVVDLGTGDNVSSYYAAIMSGAKGFVAVEPNIFEQTVAAFDKMKQMYQGQTMLLGKKRIQYSLINQDAFSFLRRLPPRSVSVLMNAIDTSIIPDLNYRQAVSNSIQRVLATRGAFISNNSYGFDLGKDFVLSEFDQIHDISKYTHNFQY